MQGCLVLRDHCDMVASPPGRGGIEGALGCPVPGEQLPQEAASPLGALAHLCQRIPKTDMEKVCENANSQLREESLETRHQVSNTQQHAAPEESLGQASSLHGDRLPPLPGQQSLQGTRSHPTTVPSKMEPPQGLERSRQSRPKLRASCGKANLPWQQDSLEEKELPQQEGQDHLASLIWLDGRARQGNPKLDIQKPELTGLEGLEAILGQQKVLEWLEAHFPTETWALTTKGEDWDYTIDKGLSRGLRQEDLEHPVSPAPPGPNNTEDEPATSQSPVLPQWGQAWPSHPGEQQPGQAGTATTTITGYALPILPWEEPLAPALQAGAYLLPAQPLGHGAPSPTATHRPEQQHQRSLFRRVLRAVRRLFLGTCVPAEQEQQRRAARAWQEGAWR
ncbi:uncharacterized protein LOC113951649 isoform X1 [Corapipo altera]|uniref:uncharacterized protein LOC113951649 isoform X1 n=1 Tax=Corapipo altera TaxID=415028 RepID=UPI000FD64A68|nr:uncharacterized protein LOC113951649 isoform X1 [Corapipo altera]